MRPPSGRNFGRIARIIAIVLFIAAIAGAIYVERDDFRRLTCSEEMMVPA